MVLFISQTSCENFQRHLSYRGGIKGFCLVRKDYFGFYLGWLLLKVYLGCFFFLNIYIYMYNYRWATHHCMWAATMGTSRS